MSKIGKKPIPLSEKVTININQKNVLIKGPEGELSFILPSYIGVKLEGNNLVVFEEKETDKSKALWGLYRQLLANAVLGVQKKWEKRLQIVGTGYNVKLEGEKLVFKLGYSHPVIFEKPKDIEFKVEKNTIISVLGVDKQKVGEVAYKIRILKQPDDYKGKGIRYEGEKIKLKPTKKVKGGAAA